MRVTSHQGRREGRLQGEAAQGDGYAGARARDVRILNWRIADSGEPRDAETVPRGSGRGAEKRIERYLARRLLYLWRSVKYEEVYVHEYTTPKEARQALREYFLFYNQKRVHQALNYQTPAMVYFRPVDSRPLSNE